MLRSLLPPLVLALSLHPRPVPAQQDHDLLRSSSLEIIRQVWLE